MWLSGLSAGLWFNSQSGQMPGLWPGSPGGKIGCHTLMFLSFSLKKRKKKVSSFSKLIGLYYKISQGNPMELLQISSRPRVGDKTTIYTVSGFGEG